MYHTLHYIMSWPTVWHKIFDFSIFPAIRKNKFPLINITSNIFPAKIYSRVNIL